MGLIDQAKKDIEQITSNLSEFAVPIVFTSPGNNTFDPSFDMTFANVSVTINGLFDKHHLGFDSESGRDVNVKHASIVVSEKFLKDAAYPVRNLKGIVNLKGHKVAVKDSTGTINTYIINEWFPDETVGVIVCILGDFK